MLQRSTQAKVVRLQEIIGDHEESEKQLKKLTADYKNNQLNVHQYNDKLDQMIARLDKTL